MWPKKLVHVDYLLNGKYYTNKNIMFKCSMLRSDSCHYSDACNVVKGRIIFKATENAKT